MILPKTEKYIYICPDDVSAYVPIKKFKKYIIRFNMKVVVSKYTNK